MAKLRIAIDNDIDFLVFSAEAAAFGYSAEAHVKVKKTGTRNEVPPLPAPDLLDLPIDQHESVDLAEDAND